MSAKFGEPWQCNNSGAIVASDGNCTVSNPAKWPRIVACVNALAGIPDPEAWVKAHNELCRFVAELAEAVDNREADIGGSRDEIEILRDAVKALAACEAAGKEKG